MHVACDLDILKAMWYDKRTGRVIYMLKQIFKKKEEKKKKKSAPERLRACVVRRRGGEALGVRMTRALVQEVGAQTD